MAEVADQSDAILVERRGVRCWFFDFLLSVFHVCFPFLLFWNCLFLHQRVGNSGDETEGRGERASLQTTAGRASMARGMTGFRLAGHLRRTSGSPSTEGRDGCRASRNGSETGARATHRNGKAKNPERPCLIYMCGTGLPRRRDNPAGSLGGRLDKGNRGRLRLAVVHPIDGGLGF